MSEAIKPSMRETTIPQTPPMATTSNMILGTILRGFFTSAARLATEFVLPFYPYRRRTFGEMGCGVEARSASDGRKEA